MNSKAARQDKMDVAYVAHLARMHLTEDEVRRFQSQLDDVLEYVQQLNELDIEHVEPTAHAVPVYNVMRPDENRPGLDRDDVMHNAPRVRDHQFVVPKIIE